MFLSRIQVFLLILITHVLLPFGMLFTLTAIINLNQYTYIIYYLLAGNILWLLYKAGSWEFTFYPLRWIFLLLWGAIGIYYVIYIRISDIYKGIYNLSAADFMMIATGIIMNLFVLFLHIRIHQAILSATESTVRSNLNIAFPCKNGTYLITDGGDGKLSSLINYHYKGNIHGKNNTNKSMRFAVDIVKMGSNKRTVKSILCNSNKAYEIFGEKIYSPIDGVVVDITNDIQDNNPFPQRLPYNVGNRVVISDGIYYIVIGHLQQGSVRVKKGDIINTGTELGTVGNSGLTPRPHIHMQISVSKDGSYWFGEGVPFTFENSFLPIKNRRYTMNS